MQRQFRQLCVDEDRVHSFPNRSKQADDDHNQHSLPFFLNDQTNERERAREGEKTIATMRFWFLFSNKIKTRTHKNNFISIDHEKMFYSADRYV